MPSAAAAAILPSVQRPVQIPRAAESQLYQAAQEPALLPQTPTASVAGLPQSTATQGTIQTRQSRQCTAPKPQLCQTALKSALILPAPAPAATTPAPVPTIQDYRQEAISKSSKPIKRPSLAPSFLFFRVCYKFLLVSSP